MECRRATLLFPFLYGSFDFIFHFDVLKEDLVELELLEMVIVLLGDVLTQKIQDKSPSLRATQDTGPGSRRLRAGRTLRQFFHIYMWGFQHYNDFSFTPGRVKMCLSNIKVLVQNPFLNT